MIRMTREEKMTPEEAIAEISFLKVAVNKVMEQALEMAISALDNKTPCSLCRFRNEDTGMCDMCPAMPLESGAE